MYFSFPFLLTRLFVPLPFHVPLYSYCTVRPSNQGEGKRQNILQNIQETLSFENEIQNPFFVRKE